jgi:predicted dehydrogenase
MAAQLKLTSGSPRESIPGLDDAAVNPELYKGWQPVSERKIRMGIVGYGLCKFGAAFGFQDHPNVEIVAVSDLFPDRCSGLAQACRCSTTYPSLEKLVKDKRIEAVFLATDAPSHAQHCITALEHGKHVAVNVPAVFGSLEQADHLLATVKRTGLHYMMFETSCFHENLYAMRQIYRAGGFGEMLYSEGEYFHYMPEPLPSYKEWRRGMPPLWYPTHATAYHVGVTGGGFTEVSCSATRSTIGHFQPGNNEYRNPFGTETALMRTSEGGIARMSVSKDTAGFGSDTGRVRGRKASFHTSYEGSETKLPATRRPPLPPGMPAGGHAGSHGFLTDEFVTAILQNRTPWIDVELALKMTVCGIIAHESALKDGERLRIPQFTL